MTHHDPLFERDDQQRAEDASAAFCDAIDAHLAEYRARLVPIPPPPTVTRDDLRAAWLDGSLTLAQYGRAWEALFPDDSLAAFVAGQADE